MQVSALQEPAWANQNKGEPRATAAADASGRKQIQPVARAGGGAAGGSSSATSLTDIVAGAMQSVVEDTPAAPAAAGPAATATPADVASPAVATPTSATPAQAAPTATDQPTLADVWNADYASDPYRVYQQMDENGWTTADLAHASGMTEQQAGDWLTRLGAQAGFGGAATVGRDAIDDPFTTAMTAAQQSGTGPGWVAAVPESRAKDDPDDGGTPSTAFDVGAFTQWYVSQDTPAAQDFSRIQGAITVDSGVVRFASGATVSMQCPDATQRDMPSPSVPTFSWQVDQRVVDYATFQKGNAFAEAGTSDAVQNAADDQLIQVFGDPNATLPADEMGERMRAMYGTPLATYMVKLQSAINAMKTQYFAAMNQALGQRPQSPDQSSPFWIANAEPDHVDPEGGQGGTALIPGRVTYTFDTDAFSTWFGQQGAKAQLIQATFGAGLVTTSTGFLTTGQPVQLALGCAEMADASNNPDGTVSNGEKDMTPNGDNSPPSVADVTLDGMGLQQIDLGDPPKMHDDRAVYFMPGYGFVTPASNVKDPDAWIDTTLDIAMVVACCAVGGEAFETFLGPVETGAAVGALGATVSQALNNDFNLKGILTGAISGALTAGVLNQLKDVSGPLGILAKAGGTALAQGATQTLMGGDFEQGALAGLASGLANAIGADVNAQIADQVSTGAMSALEACAARSFTSMLKAAIVIVAKGSKTPGYDLASAFIDEMCDQIGPPGGSAAPPAAEPAAPTSDPSPADTVAPEQPAPAAAPAAPVPPTPPPTASDLAALLGPRAWFTLSGDQDTLVQTDYNRGTVVGQQTVDATPTNQDTLQTDPVTGNGIYAISGPDARDGPATPLAPVAPTSPTAALPPSLAADAPQMTGGAGSQALFSFLFGDNPNLVAGNQAALAATSPTLEEAFDTSQNPATGLLNSFGNMLLAGQIATTTGAAQVAPTSNAALALDVLGTLPLGSEAAVGEVMAGRQVTASNYYATLGWDDARISSHMGGIDFSRPVDVITLPKGSEVVQYQLPGSPTGGYFAPAGTPAETLGINPAGREPVLYVTTEDVPVLRSSAANTAGNLSLPEAARGAGGGIQYFTNNRSVFKPIGG